MFPSSVDTREIKKHGQIKSFTNCKHQWFGVRWTLINDADTQATDTTIPKRNGNKKWLLLFLIASLIIGGTVVGLSIHFTKMPITSARNAQTTSTTTNKPAVKDHVLMLNTYKSSNVPMVIGLDGESVL